MERRFRPRVLHGQFLVRLEGVDRLVLRAVILEDALDLIHVRNRQDVDEEEHRPDHAVDGVVPKVAHAGQEVVADQVGEAKGGENENAYAEDQSH